MSEEPFDVVLVDDAEDVRAVVRAHLRWSGRFRVVDEGGTGREAVALAARHQPAVVVLDASMPDMDGLTAIPAILAAAPETKVVMLSGFDTASLSEAAVRLGAVDYVEKSAPIKDLPERLLTVLGAVPAGNAGSVEASAAAAESETVLASHLERFRTVFDQAAIGMATLTLTGTIVRANRALGQLLGEPEATFVGRTLVSLAGDKQDELFAAATAAAQTGTAQDVEHRLSAGTGSRWARTRLAAVRDASERPLYLFAQLEDVTASHRALDELRASEERFRLIVESVQDYAIFMLDPGGHISTWNLGAQRIKGWTADEIIGQHFRTFYPAARQAEGHPEHELAIAVREGRYEEEGWRVRKDGSQFWANVVITALFDHDGQHVGFAKVTRDMTERRAAEAARERAAADLAVSNGALASAARKTEEFVAITAHELQSPVAAINGAADILVQHWDRLDPVELRETLQRIAQGGTRIRRLLDDLLTASRLDAGTFAVTADRVSLSDAVERAINEVGPAVGRVVLRDVDTLAVYADRLRLVQILTNLLTNAAKYGKPPYAVEARRIEATIEVRVRDAGSGVPDDVVPRLFEKFGKDHRSTMPSTGLGLYIVRELARLQGGDAWYEPDGAFVVRLPAAD